MATYSIFLPGVFHEQRSLTGCSSHCKELDMTERLTHTLYVTYTCTYIYIYIYIICVCIYNLKFTQEHVSFCIIVGGTRCSGSLFLTT